MRNKKSNVQITKRKLSKCEGVCRTYNDIQYAYADFLETELSVTKFSCNVVLTDFELEGTYTTDFLITKVSGEIAVRECVQKDKILKPLNAKLLDASRLYWLRRGVNDWGVVVNGTV